MSLYDLWLHRVGVAGPEGSGPPETRLADIEVWSNDSSLRLCEVMQCAEIPYLVLTKDFAEVRDI